MSGPYAKQVQVYSPGMNSTAAGSAGFYRSSSVAGHNSRRSQTVDKGYRDMNPLEQSFHYDRAIRDESLRESLQSPFVNGRKNPNYINPTFQSTSFFNPNLDTQRGEALSRGRAAGLHRAASQTNVRSASVAATIVEAPTVKETPVVKKQSSEIHEAACEPVELKPSQSVKNISTANNEFNNNLRSSRRTSEIPAAGLTKNRDLARVQSAVTFARNENANVQELNVCDGCVNWQLAEEVNERKKNFRNAEIEAENEILERNAYAQRVDRENYLRHRSNIVDVSKANFESFKEKAQRKASGEREDVELKVNTDKGVAAESLRSLQRYQSMLDKMYESSIKKIGERKAELKMSQTHNRSQIERHEQTAEQKGTTKQCDFNHRGDKSLLDAMYENSSTYLNSQAYERRRASEYNYQTNETKERSRLYSPGGPIQDPFKHNTDHLEDAGAGNSVLDKMFYNSMEHWRRAKQGTYESSRSNREVSAGRKTRGKDYDSVHEGWSGYKRGWKQGGASVLDSVYTSDQNGLSYRRNINLDCAEHNRGSGYSPEKHQLKNLEFYYKSPTKKVNDRDAVDYEQWSKNGGVFAKIEAATDRLEQSRKDQYSTLGGSIKKQMVESATQRVNEQAQNRNFKETPLLVCAHKNNVMYCNVCNRKVPMNKISKIVGEYQKLMKGRGRK